ncbi:MAG: FxsA family protein [Mycobacteriaceae bacterium]
MPLLAFLLYAALEVAALIAIGSALGIGWTLLLILVMSIAGLFLTKSQGSKVLKELRQASRGNSSATGAITNSALVALGTVLLVVPGFITAALGLLLLIPVTRWVLRPVISFIVLRRLTPQFAIIGTIGGLAATILRVGKSNSDYIEGEVIDNTVDDLPSLVDTSCKP